MKVEANDAGALDDILLCTASDALLAIQVKFSAHPDRPNDPYDWNSLLTTSEGASRPKPSLLAKWAASYRRLRLAHQNVRCLLVSNRLPSPSLRAAMTADGHIDLNAIADSTLLHTIEQHVGGREQAAEFFSNFELDLDRETLSNLTNNLRQQFLSDWGRTESDWANLVTAVGKWVQHPDQPNPDGRILLRDIRIAAGWQRAQRLPEYYALPSDFVLPDQRWHDAFMESILGSKSGTFVIGGPAGSGKSTYLSFLFNCLTGQGITVLRHHYYIPEHSEPGRRSAERVALELIYQIEDQLPGTTIDQLEAFPVADALAKWLIGASEYLSAAGSKLVFIIDGLDYVTREDASTRELDRLFEHLLPAPAGLVIIVGTQRTAEHITSRRLLSYAPPEGWLDPPRFSTRSLVTLLAQHSGEFGFSLSDTADYNQVYRTAVALEERTSGLPLFVRYLLGRLLELRRWDPWAVGSLAFTKNGTLDSYYRSLWYGLSATAKTMLHMVVAVDVAWRKEWLFSCLERTGIPDYSLQTAFDEIRHLIELSKSAVRPIHRSLSLFVGELADPADARRVQQNVLEWLALDAPEYCRWAYEWTVAEDAGDSTHLVAGPTREWLQEAFLKGRPLTRAVQLIDRATSAALRSGALSRHIELTVIGGYAYNALHLRGDELDVLELPRLLISTNPVQDRTSPAAIAAWAEYCVGQGMIDGLGDLLKDVLKYADRRRAAGSGDEDVSEIVKAQAAIAALDDAVSIERIAHFLNQQSLTARAAQYGDLLGSAFRAFRKLDRLRRLIAEVRDSVVRKSLGRHLAILEFEEGSDVDTSSGDLHPLARILTGQKDSSFSAANSELPGVETALELQGRELWDLTYDFTGLALERLFLAFVHDQIIFGAIPGRAFPINDSPWLSLMFESLRTCAVQVAERLASGSKIGYAWLHQQLAAVPSVSSRDDELGYRVRRALRRRLAAMTESAMVASRRPLSLTREDCSALWNAPTTELSGWLEWCCSIRRACLDADAIGWIAENARSLIEKQLGQGNERSVAHSRVAMLAVIHGDRELGRTHAERAAMYTFSYGYHKDLNLPLALEAIDLTFGVSQPHALDAIAHIAPAVIQIDNFTDGDETSHVAEELGTLIARHQPNKLPAYYMDLVRRQEYVQAQNVMHSWLEHSEMNGSLSRAISSTMIDARSLQIISQRASHDHRDAIHSLDSSPSSLGQDVPQESGADASDAAATDFPIADQYPPEKLGEYLQRLKIATYRTDQGINTWVAVWLRVVGPAAVLRALDENDPDGTLGDLDTRFELALKVKGRTAAFSYLVLAQARSGWGSFSSDKQRATRWKYVKDLYQDRWIEFLIDSASRSSMGYSDGRISVGALRVGEFLLKIGRGEESLAVLTSFIRNVCDALAVFSFPPVEWIASTANETDLLFSRLLWPSLLVREATVRAVARELSQNPNADLVEALMAWIRTQEIEAAVLPALLAIYLANEQTSAHVVGAEALAGAVSRPSLLSNMLTRTMFGSVKLVDVYDLHSGTAPESYVPSKVFFEKLRVIPESYMSLAEALEKWAQIPLVRQWAYEFDQVCKRLGQTPGMPSFQAWTHTRGMWIPALDAPLSEAYASGYLRALAWASGRRVNPSICELHAARVCPIDLSLWTVMPGKPPLWLPEKQDTAVEPQRPWEASSLVIWCEDLINRFRVKDEPETPIYVEAQVKSNRGVLDLKVEAFLQSTHGVVAPTASEVGDWLDRLVWIRADSEPLRADGPVQEREVDEERNSLGDWILHRLSVPLFSHTSQRWQWWRLTRLPRLPAPYLISSGVSVVCSTEGVSAVHGGAVVGRWHDWLEDFGEFRHSNLPPATGCVLNVKTEQLSEWENRFKANLAWLCTVSAYTREHDFGEYSVEVSSVIIGAGRIIQG